MFKKFKSWFENLSIWDMLSKNAGCVAWFVILFVVLLLWAATFGVVYVIVGWVNAGFSLGITTTQMLIISVVVWVLLSALAPKSVIIHKK